MSNSFLSQNQSNPDSNTYQCSHCQIYFPSEQQYKFHYKTELHQYNLKRKILDLPPISEEQFNLQFHRDQSETSVHSNLLYCPPCGKSFSTKSTLSQHLLSKKHQERAQAAQQKAFQINQQNQRLQDTESDTSASKQLEKKFANEDNSVCLFCNKKSGNLSSSVSHMKIAHGFYLQQDKFISNYKGLIQYLANKINVDLECIHCEAVFKSASAVQSHMIDKQHCFMQNLNSQQPQILTFYDFTRKIEQFPKKQSCDIVAEEKEENEEDTKSQSSSFQILRRNSEDLQSNLSDWEACDDNNIDFQNMEQKKTEFVNYLQSLQQDIKINPSGEVELSNGKLLGHRAYKKYYQMYYRDFQEYTKKQNQKMLEDTNKNYVMRKCITNKEEQSQDQIEAVKKEKKMEYKELSVNVPKKANMEKEKSKYGSDKFNNRGYLVSFKKEKI